MRGLLWLVRKDLMIFFADRQGALMTVLVPVVLASLLGMLFAPRSSSTVLQLLVVTSEQNEKVQDFVAAIAASESFEVEQVDEATARARVGSGKASLALILPLGTAEALRPAAMFQGEQRHAELLYDPSDEIEATMAAGLLTQVLMQETMGAISDRTTMGEMFVDLEKSLAPDADAELRDFVTAGRGLAKRPEGTKTETEEGGGMQPPLAFDRSEAAATGLASQYNSYAHNFAGMLLMFLLFAAQSRAKHLVAERQNGTLVRLRLSPVSDRTILLGAGLSTTVIALLASAVVYVVGIVVFRIEILGSLAGFLGILLCQALFVGAFALLLAGLGRTEEQIGSIGTFVVLVLSFAGGAMFPSFMMPEWLRTLSLALPTYWATHGLAAMTWRGLGLSAAWLPMAVLLVSAAVCAGVGIRRFRFRE
jgi:linearmycin/streptolysin S transport system permease protein